MTEQEYNAGLEKGSIVVEAPPDDHEDTSVAPVSNIPIEQFIPVLMQLQSTQRCLTAAPTFVPKAFLEQIQFVFTGGNYYCYLYFNNQWNSFSVTGGGGATVAQLFAGTGISISPGGGTGNVTITNTGVTSIIAGSGITVSGPTGNVTIATSGSAVAGKFGGTGADGALTLTSGTTNFNLGGALVFIKNYTSISVTGTAAVTFSNPHANGTLIVFRSQGNVTWTSSGAVTADGMGSAGAASGATFSPGDPGNSFGSWGYQGTITPGQGGQIVSSVSRGGGGGASVTTAGGSQTNSPGGSPPTHIVTTANTPIMIWPAIPGSGGGSGASNAAQGPGAGGAGGGAFYCECAGALNITSTFNANGVNGGNTINGGVAGGGGGGGGCFIFLYNVLTANTATFNVNGGTGGTIAHTGFETVGSDGASGFSAVVQNLLWV